MAREAEAAFMPSTCPPFLDGLSPELRQQVTLNSRRVRYPPGTVAWHEGDPMECAILVSGLARVFISSDAGRQATIRYVHAGELMGAAMVTHEPFPASVQIVAAGVIQYLDPDGLIALFHTNNEFSVAIADDLATRLVHNVKVATVLIFGSTVQKLAHDLLERACREQLATGKLVVKATQQELADSINSSREVVSRAVGVLRRRGVIGPGVGTTTVLDARRLEKVAWRGII
jgi:CRP-like cAMP-binding protein